MKVVSDTSPICYLVLIGEIEILPVLYGRIFVPEAVVAELGHAKAPFVLRSWIENPPGWLNVRRVKSRSGWSSDRLQEGELEAISLADDLGADLVILDDQDAREVALERGLKVTGFLGILERAAERDLVDLPNAVERLRKTSFHAVPQLLKDLLDRQAR